MTIALPDIANESSASICPNLRNSEAIPKKQAGPDPAQHKEGDKNSTIAGEAVPVPLIFETVAVRRIEQIADQNAIHVRSCLKAAVLMNVIEGIEAVTDHIVDSGIAQQRQHTCAQKHE